MAQRRGNAVAKNGDDWADVDSFVLSNLHANEHAKFEMGPNQTKKLFLHLARRYNEESKLQEILRFIEVEAFSTHDFDADALEGTKRLVEGLSAGSQVKLLAQILGSFEGTPDQLQQLAELASVNLDASKVVAASLNLAQYTEAIEQLETQIELNPTEGFFQTHLSRNPWMFGSEYSELLNQRAWIRDQNTDFMMRRTVDGYLEIIEIKRPFAEPLFRFDPSHRSWFPQQELSKVVGQVMGYIEEIDAARDSIERRDGEQSNKIRAKIIIGRDNDIAQVEALRRFNSHLHRIEIMTFDQLARIAHQVRSHLQDVLTPVPDANVDIDDVPF